MGLTDIRKKTPKKGPPVPMMPDDIAAKKHVEEEKKARAARIKQSKQKLQIVPGPVALDWLVDPTETDFFQAMEKILQTQWTPLPEKGVSRREIAEVYQWRKSLPKLVMSTHLHAVFLNDSTFVEREIRRNCQDGTMRRLMVNMVDGGELVIKADEYYRVLHEWTDPAHAEVFRQFEVLLREMPEAGSFSIYDLESQPDLAANRSIIMTTGFLTLQAGQSDQFNISIPNIGRFLKLVGGSRKWVQSSLQKSPWNEITETKLKERWESNKTYWREFRGASIEWTLSDCYGGGWCEPFKTPMGRGWKLTGKK